MRRNQKGSALLWAITVIMVLMITVAAALGISYSYYNRSVNNNSKRQAYLTAKGVIQNIVEKIELDNEEYIALIPEEADTTTQLNIALSEDYNLGKITDAKVSKIKLKEDEENVRGKITISVTVDYAGQEETVNADMQLGRKGELKKWQLLKYYKGEPAEVQENDNIRNAKIMLSYVTPILNAGQVSNQAYREYLESFPDIYKKTLEYYPNVKNPSFNNDSFRSYVFVGHYYEEGKSNEETVPKFKNELAPNLPESLKNKEMYMQIYCTQNAGTCFIYSSTAPVIKESNGEKWKARLVFNEENGHWYDTTINPKGEGYGIVPLSNPNREEELEKWKNFKNEYFIEERCVDCK